MEKFQLKRLSRDSIPAAMAKAERYRLLNQPWAAESICLDVLEIEPANQSALILLLLCLTDQFEKGPAAGVARARGVLSRLTDPYLKAYYSGVICERRAKAHLTLRAPGAESVAYQWFREAMDWYEKAEPLRPPGNDEAILRWNTCVRILTQNPEIAPRPDVTPEPVLGE
jgi:hypothetical protein